MSVFGRRRSAQLTFAAVSTPPRHRTSAARRSVAKCWILFVSHDVTSAYKAAARTNGVRIDLSSIELVQSLAAFDELSQLGAYLSLVPQQFCKREQLFIKEQFLWIASQPQDRGHRAGGPTRIL